MPPKSIPKRAFCGKFLATGSCISSHQAAIYVIINMVASPADLPLFPATFSLARLLDNLPESIKKPEKGMDVYLRTSRRDCSYLIIHYMWMTQTHKLADLVVI